MRFNLQRQGHQPGVVTDLLEQCIEPARLSELHLPDDLPVLPWRPERDWRAQAVLQGATRGYFRSAA